MVLFASSTSRLWSTYPSFTVSPTLSVALVRLVLAGDHAEERGLARAVRADDADDAAGREHEGHALDQDVVAVGLGHVLGLDHDLAQPRSRRNVDLQLLGPLLGLLGQHLLVGADARLGLRVPALGRHPDPLELACQRLLAFALGLLLQLQPLALLLEPGGVVPLPGDALAAVEFQDPAGHVVQEVAVVGHGDDRALVLLKMVLEPGNGFGIEMVRGLVEQQDVRLLEQQPAERHAPLLAAGKHLHDRVAGGTAERVHGHLEPAVQLPGVQMVELLLHLALPRDQLVHLVVGHGIGEALVDLVVLVQEVDGLLHALFHDLAHGLFRIELRLLLEEPDGVARGEHRLAHDTPCPRRP